MIRRPPRSTRTDTLFPYTSLFRSVLFQLLEIIVVIQSRRFGCAARCSLVAIDTSARSGWGIRGSRYWHWCRWRPSRSEEHTSELQSLMRISYAVFCLTKKNIHTQFNELLPSTYLYTHNIYQP